MESYHVAIIRTDGLTAGWRADYAERDAAVDDLRRYATRAASERRKRKIALPKDGSPVNEFSVDAAPGESLWPRRLQQ